ncbi:hypothetical protein [Arthrobacter nitrophenolicus]|uniref:Uncharacterized protein n=1 Tax=Arthrobacter nitrophenolicus TaxID=683150 RepID=A0A4R5XTA8_9MICC|nr:hypothetical protein [Arthrobacter nitrophenolicus]TDL34047.1 hypothetical protein E2R57_16195 [Arthrobacter nitrophenolicus]
MNLSRYILDAVELTGAGEVHIIGLWEDRPDAGWIVYRRTIDPTRILGRRLEFHKTAADGTIEGFARDVAINLVEPIGTARRTQDRHGIVWVGVPVDCPTPELPEEILRALGGNSNT